ncbi:MAG: DUF2061 domain-containing protein [Patescibacteria group bacterium]|nr:DUF2061 domain-containing protein [Patescibacteria group bacterium]
MRSFTKGVMWQMIGVVVTLSVVYLFTQNIGITASIGALEVFFKIILYYLHERLWDGIEWGKTKSGQ